MIIRLIARRLGRRAATLVRRYAQSVPELYTPILELRDSLFLTNEQSERLQAAQSVHTARVATAWGSLARYLVSLGDRYDTKSAITLQSAAISEVWRLNWAEAQTLNTILDPTQLKLLPFPATYLRNITKPPTGF